MLYPIALHVEQSEEKNQYGVSVPDLPGCFSAAKTLEGAHIQAKAAIEAHVSLLVELDEVQSLTMPKDILVHMQDPDYKDALWALVEVDLVGLLAKSRYNVVLPQALVVEIDKVARNMGSDRSAFLADAAIKHLNSLK